MPMEKLTREILIDAIQKAVEPLDEILAMYQGGSAAFGKADEMSDVDLQIIAVDEFAGHVIPLVEDAFAAVAIVKYRNEIPQPTWHGHRQVFYRFGNASPYLMLDLVVICASSPNKFLEPEIHGERVIAFDKTGITTIPPLDQAALQKTIEAARRTLLLDREFTGLYVTKELNRDHFIEAVTYYFAYTLNPLITLLRMKYSPARYNFRTKKVYDDLPEEVLARIAPFYAIRDANDLREKDQLASSWIRELVVE
jgi:hypothetical protein